MVKYYRKKPIVIQAGQWFKMGDHPEVMAYADDSEDALECKVCGKPFTVHGHITTLEGWMRVCPGDWIVIGVNREAYPVKPNIFEKTYEGPLHCDRDNNYTLIPDRPEQKVGRPYEPIPDKMLNKVKQD